MGNIKNNWFYIKTFKMNSIFWRTFLIISLLLAVPFISISIIFYSNTFKIMKEKVMFENSSMLDSTKNITDSTLSECDMMSCYIANNESTQLFMLNNKYSDSFSSILNLSKTLPIIYKYIDSIYIYSESTNSIIDTVQTTPINEFSDNGWVNAYKSVNNAMGITIPRNKNNTYPSLITIVKPIYVADEKKGAVIMNINSQSLYNSMLADIYKNGQEFFLVDTDNRIILSKDISYFNTYPENIGFNIESMNTKNEDVTCEINGENHIILSANSRQFGFTYISTYPMTLYEQQASQVRLQILLISLSILIFGFILAYIASAKSYTPLHDIISFLDTATPMDNINTKDKDELMYIINSIKLHIDDKARMEEILDERMKMLKKAQYDMLQTQINPHFLYNTLETINWMAYGLSNSENPVSKSLVILANFFKNSLSSSGYLISIEDEIKYTREYLNILDLRYGDLFDIKWEFDESILSFNIIKICLQPIIENAVYHGFKPKNNKGLLTILGRRCNDNIIITVRDNGIGMDESTVRKINESLHENVYSEKKQHIGLSNVNKRIKIIFGNDFGITVVSHLGTGTDVYITIPAIK